ncbi:hypothetical protein DFH08DRAFT_868002 [Mycena albidolilacea]|uniref:Uncharacterized protein n=1 Tax=Mycena albidolilacea TaxID=1033008 RepID=A0AAD7A149_9AGAR|nr:hypothetical protein DFH08DRAFT_868002 [Mycena albidolilacea]
MFSSVVKIVALAAMFGSAESALAAKPTGGPAAMTLQIWSGPFTCPAPDSTIPADGSAGTLLKTISIPELTCAVANFPLGSAFNATITATPKTGTLGCYIQLFAEQGCGATLTNQYHGYPFGGTAVGSAVGCGNPVAFAYGAVEIVCE